VLQELDKAGVPGAGFDTALLHLTNESNDASMSRPDFHNRRTQSSHQLCVIEKRKSGHSNNSTTTHRQTRTRQQDLLSNVTGRRVTTQAKQLEGSPRRTQVRNSKQRNHKIKKQR
jgi:hypothetical protein